MQTLYDFRNIQKQEVAQMFDLVLQRMRWMDQNGIQQWNKTRYDQIYPLAYYEEKRRKGELFVLVKRPAGQMVCAGVLFAQDPRWSDNAPSLYLHNFVSKIGQKGAGAVFLAQAQAYARQLGKAYFRLDCSAQNQALLRYYASFGFVPAGTCKEGAYQGILLQKRLDETSL